MMVKKALKRKVSGLEDGASERQTSVNKKARKKTMTEDRDSQTSEDVVKEFLKLTGVKQTRLKGFKQFVTTIKNADKKDEIILKYLQTHPDCSEMFDVLKESPEERSLFEVQIVVEILEVIVLHLAGEDARTKSRAAVIVSRLLTNHRKLVYHCLNSASPANATMAVLRLLTAIVMHGPALARELLIAFDFSHKTFGALVNRREKKDVVDVRTCFIKFVLSFFVTGDQPLIQQVLQIKGFATSILKNLHKDSAEVIHLVLSTLFAKIVQNRSILKKTKILLFTSYSLSQLARLYNYENDSSIRERIHQFLLELCTKPHGIAFENQLGIFSVGSNNPILLRFLHSLPKTLSDDLLIELIIRILKNSPDLISPYLSGYQMALDPRNSQQWLNNVVFLIKLYFHLPMPTSIFKNPAISADRVSTSKLLTIVCPENVKRNIVTRGLQHPDAVVQGTTLSLLLVILRRSSNMVQSTNIDEKILALYRENILKLLPSFQILISIRENLSNRTIEARDCASENVKDLPPQLSIKDGTILLSRTLACMSLFQTLSPTCFIQSNYDPWKLLPRTVQEEPLYNLSSKYSMLRIFLCCPSRHFKWYSQSKMDTFVYFKQILQLYCHEKDPGITDMARKLLNKFLVETGVCDSNKAEVSIWLRSMLEDCIDDRDVVISFVEKVYCRLASDPFDLVDDVVEAVHTSTVTMQSFLTKDAGKRSLPFTPVVPCALKLFVSFLKNVEDQNDKAVNLDILARYINVVMLDILELQTDPKPLCNMIVKILTQDDVSSCPLHTRLLLDYVAHWSSGGSTDDRKCSKKLKHPLKKDKVNQLLSLPPKEFKKQIISSEEINLPLVVNYLRCNPVLLFDSDDSPDIQKTLGELPCFLMVRQLLIFVFKSWKSDTAFSDPTSLWDMPTFEALVSGLHFATTMESIEFLERTVSATLFLATNVVHLYLENSENRPVFLEIARKVTEILRITLEKAREMSATKSRKTDLDAGKYDNHDDTDDATNDDVIDDIITNDVIHKDVIDVLDKTCQQKSGDKTVESDGLIFAKIANMVFEHGVFRNLFCYQTGKDSPSLCHVSEIMSDCVAELLRHFQQEILQDKNCKYLESYVFRIAQAVKEEAFGGQNAEVKRPYNVSSVSLLKQFQQYFPTQVLSEILQAYSCAPKERFIQDRSGKMETELNRNGEMLIQIFECFLDRESHFEHSLSSDISDGILHLLMSINCQECDEIIAAFVTKYAKLSDTVLSAVLNHSLKQANSICIQTAVLVTCQRTALLTQLESWLLNRVDKKQSTKEALRKEAMFLETEWETFLPLLLFYLSAIKKDETSPISEQRKECLKYVRTVCLLRLKEWLLEINSTEQSNDCFKILCLLLEVDEIDGDFMHNLFAETVVQERFLKLNLHQLEAVERVLQYLVNQSSNRKEQKKYRTIFLYACMQRLAGMMKSEKDDQSLTLKILHYLEANGKEALRFKKIELFSVEDFVNVTNGFVKSALSCRQYRPTLLNLTEEPHYCSKLLNVVDINNVSSRTLFNPVVLQAEYFCCVIGLIKFRFTCSQTLYVLSVLISTIWESCSSKLLLPPTDLFKFILSHSKFLEIFLGNTDASSGDRSTKGAVVELLQTVVNLEPKCCEPSHLFLILGAYSAKLSLTDQKLLRLLFTYEGNLGDTALGSRVLWGEAAIEAYQAAKNGPTTLWHEPDITQILDLLDSKLLLQSAKHFPQRKPLQPGLSEDFGADSQFYDPSFLLPIFSFFLASSCEVNCRRFIESSALAYTISALTSHEKEMRQVAYQILSRFQHHLSSARFREKQQVVHLLHYFQNGITEPDCRISSLITSFMARALHIFFYPEDPLYLSVNSYMLQKAFMDLRDVPLFLSHLNNSDLTYRTERTWLLHLILDGLRDPMDYYVCKRFHVFQQLLTLYNSAVADKALQKLVLKIVHEVCRHHAAAYDLCQNYGLVSWLLLLINTNSDVSESFRQIVDILTTLWFTLIGQNKSHDETSSDDVTNRRPSIPKNVCSELLLVLLSVLQSRISLKTWNAEIFTSFSTVLASLLDHQHHWTNSAEVILTKHHCIQLCQVWRHLFGKIDICSKLLLLIKPGFSASHSQITIEQWFKSMKNVLEILNSSHVMQCSEEAQERLQMYRKLSKLEATHFDNFLDQKLREASQTFLTISDSSMLSKNGQDLLFLSRVVFDGVK